MRSHERMHRHRGLSAAAAGTIAMSDYRLLLARLYGFHRAFEAVMEAAAPDILIRLDLLESRKVGCNRQRSARARA